MNRDEKGDQNGQGTMAADQAGAVEHLVAEVTELKDQLLRSLAEQENVRRRAERARREAARFAAWDFAKDLLESLDNLRRAIDAVEGQVGEHGAMRNLLSGITATERGLLDALARHGVRPIVPALGEPLDPNRHEAMFEVGDRRWPAGSVAQVVEPGYLYHDRLLRPALVGIAANARDTAPDPESSDTAGMPKSTNKKD